MSRPESSGAASSLETLYPFLPGGGFDLPTVVAEVRSSIEEKLRELAALRAQVLETDAVSLENCARAMAAAFAAGGRLFAFGNGGSATDAANLASLFLHSGPGARPLPAYALTGDVAAVTALSNDVGFDPVFARLLAVFARPGDIAVGLSTSGNSPNLLAAFEEAHRRGLLTVGLSGSSGGKMAELTSIDHLFVMPSASMHRIQEAQTTVYHVLWELVSSQPGQ